MAKTKVKKLPIILLVVFLVLLVVGSLVACFISLDIKLENKKDEYEINVNSEEYEKASVKCTFFGGNVDVKADKTVDTKKLGKVTVTYSCSKLLFTKSVKAVYLVVDKEKPVIELTGKKINVIYAGKSYTEEGYKAKDNSDGDVSSKVVVDSKSVDYNKEGNYKITYSVKDTTGNEGTAEREILVRKQNASNLTCGEPGVIYLTFDDGPSATTTPKILDTLKKYSVKATFFVTNKGPDELIKREADEGHMVGLHTASHDYAKIYKSSAAFFEDLNAVAARVEKLTGKKATVTRFPGGSSNTVSKHYKVGIMTQLAKEVEEQGYSYFDWNIVSGDAGDLKSTTYEGKVKEEIQNVTYSLSKAKGNIVLMHDIKETTMDALEDIIKYGVSNGYKFDVLTRDTSLCHQRIWN